MVKLQLVVSKEQVHGFIPHQHDGVCIFCLDSSGSWYQGYWDGSFVNCVDEDGEPMILRENEIVAWVEPLDLSELEQERKRL